MQRIDRITLGLLLLAGPATADGTLPPPQRSQAGALWIGLLWWSAPQAGLTP